MRVTGGGGTIPPPNPVTVAPLQSQSAQRVIVQVPSAAPDYTTHSSRVHRAWGPSETGGGYGGGGGFTDANKPQFHPHHGVASWDAVGSERGPTTKHTFINHNAPKPKKPAADRVTRSSVRINDGSTAALQVAGAGAMGGGGGGGGMYATTTASHFPGRAVGGGQPRNVRNADSRKITQSKVKLTHGGGVSSVGGGGGGVAGVGGAGAEVAAGKMGMLGLISHSADTHPSFGYAEVKRANANAPGFTSMSTAEAKSRGMGGDAVREAMVAAPPALPFESSAPQPPRVAGYTKAKNANDGSMWETMGRPGFLEVADPFKVGGVPMKGVYETTHQSNFTEAHARSRGMAPNRAPASTRTHSNWSMAGDLSEWEEIALNRDRFRTSAQDSARGVQSARTPAPPNRVEHSGRNSKSEVPLKFAVNGGKGLGAAVGTSNSTYGYAGGDDLMFFPKKGMAPVQRIASAPVRRATKPLDTLESLAWAPDRGAGAAAGGVTFGMAPHGTTARAAFANPGKPPDRIVPPDRNRSTLTLNPSDVREFGTTAAANFMQPVAGSYSTGGFGGGRKGYSSMTGSGVIVSNTARGAH